MRTTVTLDRMLVLPASWRGRLRAVDWRAAAAFALPFLLYMLTLAPTIYNLDSAELTTAAATGGIIRATGYPLYTVVGRLFALLPWGDVAYRLNLMSAFFGALTILLAELLLRRLRVCGWARLGALGLLAVSPYFWALSLIAEVYTLHTALMAGVILSLFYWGEAPSAKRLLLPAALLSLSMGNHAATVLLVPGAVWYVATRAPRQLAHPAAWLAVVAGLALGGTVFLYLPLRYGANPAFNYAGTYDASGLFHAVNLRRWDGFLWLVTGRTFAGQMFGYSLAELWSQVQAYGLQLWEAFFIIGVGPGLLGALVLWRRDWRLGGMFLLMFAANAIFYVNYRVADKNTMFLPTYLVWALWLGLGYQTLLSWVLQEVPAARAAWPVRGILLLAVLASLAWNWRRVDLSHDWSVRQQSEAALQAVEPNALIFGWWDTVPAIQYLQLVEGQRPDVLAINRFLIGGDDMRTLIEKEAAYRPIYINNPPLYFVQTMDVTRVGPLYRLQKREQSR